MEGRNPTDIDLRGTGKPTSIALAVDGAGDVYLAYQIGANDS